MCSSVVDVFGKCVEKMKGKGRDEENVATASCQIVVKSAKVRNVQGGSSPGRGRSSIGRAPQWHCGGQGFDSPRLHQARSLDGLTGSRNSGDCTVPVLCLVCYNYSIVAISDHNFIVCRLAGFSS